MLICPYCGNELEDYDCICGKCGKAIEQNGNGSYNGNAYGSRNSSYNSSYYGNGNSGYNNNTYGNGSNSYSGNAYGESEWKVLEIYERKK